jgi:hypothetical protein
VALRGVVDVAQGPAVRSVPVATAKWLEIFYIFKINQNHFFLYNAKITEK